jgi:hypothetical protein
MYWFIPIGLIDFLEVFILAYLMDDVVIDYRCVSWTVRMQGIDEL